MTDIAPLTDEQLAAVIRALTNEVEQVRAQVAAAYAFADEMADYCSPHGVAAGYAQRLRDALDAAAPSA